MTVKLVAGTRLAEFVKRARPTYRKRSVSYIETNAVTLSGGYWDEGSRDDYSHHTLTGSSASTLRYPTAPPQFGGADAPRFEIPAGTIVVNGGTFCGRESGLTLYASKEDIATLMGA